MAFSLIHLHSVARRAGDTLIHGLSLWCRPADDSWANWRMLWNVQLALIGTWNVSVLRSGLKEIAMWVANGELATRCLSNQVSISSSETLCYGKLSSWFQNPTEPLCSMFSEMMSNTSMTGKINIIALWRGYISISIENRIYESMSLFLDLRHSLGLATSMCETLGVSSPVLAIPATTIQGRYAELCQ
jgi:hypothetical protein